MALSFTLSLPFQVYLLPFSILSPYPTASGRIMRAEAHPVFCTWVYPVSADPSHPAAPPISESVASILGFSGLHDTLSPPSILGTHAAMYSMYYLYVLTQRPRANSRPNAEGMLRKCLLKEGMRKQLQRDQVTLLRATEL